MGGLQEPHDSVGGSHLTKGQMVTHPQPFPYINMYEPHLLSFSPTLRSDQAWAPRFSHINLYAPVVALLRTNKQIWVSTEHSTQ